jgi:multidrug efflux pump subunit AcrB
VVRRYEVWRDEVILHRIVPAYARLLNLSLRYRYVALAAATAVLIMSAGMLAGGRLVFVFLPTEDSETLVINLRMSLGTSIERTAEVAARIEEAVRAQEETKSISAVVGQRSNLDTGTVDALATHLAEMFVELKPIEDRDRPSDEVIASIREHLGVIEDAERISYAGVSGGPSGADITLELQGADGEMLLAASDAVKHELSRFEGVRDIFDDNAMGQPELQINLKPAAAALGFTVSNVAAQMRGALYGIDAHVFSEQQEDIDVRVRVDETTRRSLHSIETIWLISPDGARVPLSEVAELVDGSSHATIRRVDRARAITVTADTDPAISPETITAEFGRSVLPGLRAEYPGVSIKFAGRQEQMADAFASLPIGMVAAMLLIYLILAWLFSSYTQPFAVMLAIPFGLIGVIWGHLALGFDLTFLSLIGFVALSGIIVNDSLILMQFYNTRREEGATILQGLIEAGQQRLRPIFLTTITTVLGLTPLMLEQSFQARFLIPMAISISFGLMSGTVLILLVLPCIVVIVDDIKAVLHFLWFGRPRSATVVGAETVVDVLGD